MLEDSGRDTNDSLCRKDVRVRQVEGHTESEYVKDIDTE